MLGPGAIAEREMEPQMSQALHLGRERDTSSEQTDQLDKPKIIMNYDKFEGSQQGNLSNMVKDSLSE